MSTGGIQLAQRRGLHRFAVTLAGLVVLLIAAGALVKSKEAGLSVPDWPLSYGSLNPPRWWTIENVRAEHGHRLIAGTVALLTVVLASQFHRREPRAWVRRIAYLAVAAVFAQALLGGITVLMFLPTAVSVSHAGLAQLFLCLVVTLAMVTSTAWLRADFTLHREAARRRLARLATALTGLVYLQILLGAVMRHTGAGLAIPDFPLVFGALVPPRFDDGVTIHYAHRVGALLVLCLAVALVWQVLRRFRDERTLLAPAITMGLLVALQIGLGGAVVLTSRAVAPNTVHVAVGALILGNSLAMTLCAWRGVRVLERKSAGAATGRREQLELREAAS
ncbi:MAG: heme A synthase [Thermoanaerobaculia bacterium]